MYNKNSKTSQNEASEVKQKKYLRVIADMRPNAQIIPLKIVSDDGREFIIQNVFNIVRIIVEDIGEQCMAYYMVVGGKRKVIYLDKNMQWFVIWYNSTFFIKIQ